ncbi:MAG: hypothetical protein ACRDNS_30475 [Trebonia sp.]
MEAGAVVDEFDLPGIGRVVARHTRHKTADAVSWACMFTVVASGVADLAVVHRLSAPSLAEARKSVRHAVEFLAGHADRPAPLPEALPPAGDRRGDRSHGLGASQVTSGRIPLPERYGVEPRTPTFRVPPDHTPAPLR